MRCTPQHAHLLLLARAIQQHGWRSALLYEAIAIDVIVTLLALLVIRDRPADMGLEKGSENQGRPDGVRQKSSLRWSAILGRRDFWIPSLTLASSSGLIVNRSQPASAVICPALRKLAPMTSVAMPKCL